MQYLKQTLIPLIAILGLSACSPDFAPSLPMSDDSLSIGAGFMQDFGPGEGIADDCYAPTCSLPGEYAMPHRAVNTKHPAMPALGDPFKATMAKMRANMPVMGAGADRDFLKGMLPHHQAAVDMADLELAQGSDPEMRSLAATIKAGQLKEIEQMQMLLDHHALSAGDTSAMNDYMAAMHHMHMNMPESETGSWDVDFVRNMIPHHQAAVDMARTLLNKGRDPNVRRLALDIIGAQQTEINYMTVWLNRTAASS